MNRRFRKYGAIESTEVLKSGKDGYVTFVNDRYACLAFDREKRHNCEVAYTWHQPPKVSQSADKTDGDESMETNQPFTTLHDLNDDCLFAVFDYCDNLSLVNLSDTCTQLNRLLRHNYNFTKRKTFILEGDNGHISTTLADVRRTFRLMGSTFEKLELWFMGIAEGKTIFRYLQFIVRYAEKHSFKEMMLEISFWDDDLFNPLLLPILKNLQVLRLSVEDWNDIDIDLDLAELCPKLKKLVLCDIVVQQNCFKSTVKTLESFCWMHNWNQLDSLQFFERNRQIKDFKCISIFCEDLSSIAIHLPNVETLTLVLKDWEYDNFLHLNRFERLTKLELGFSILSNVDNSKVLEYIKSFDKLLELKLHFLMPTLPEYKHQQMVVAISQKIINLEQFSLMNIQLGEATVIKFVQFATKLETLHLHGCNIYATESLITKLVNIRKSIRNPKKLKLFLDVDYRNDLFVIRAMDTQQYLKVKLDCNHDFDMHINTI